MQGLASTQVRLTAALVALLSTACAPTEPARFVADDTSQAAPSAPAPAGQEPVPITLLYTSDEHGWVLPFEREGQPRGGAAAFLAQLVRREGHCAGRLPSEPERIDPPAFLAPPSGAAPRSAAGSPAPALAKAPDPCVGANTLLLSGGDNYAGPAVSGYYRGATMASAMARLGYAAAAFGNHEFDYGKPAFFANRARAGVPYLAANMVSTGGAEQDVTVPTITVQRAGVSIGVVGLSTEETLQAAMASRFAGLSFENPERALARAIPELWASGVDAVVLLAHECRREIDPIIARHPEWQLSFVGLGHCHKAAVEQVGGVPVVAPSWRLEQYARVRLLVDPAGSGPRRAQVLSSGLVPVVPAAGVDGSVDSAFDERLAGWKATVDAALGETIGHTNSGLAQGSAALGAWVVRTWRERLTTDVAISTSGAIRQELPAGPIRLATVYSILPFENALVVARIPGKTLLAMLDAKRTIAAGVVRRADGSFRLLDGKPVEAERLYRVATTDYLYFGGDGYPFREADPGAQMTGVDWRAPVIEWTREQKTSAKRPLEAVIRSAR